MVSTSTSSPSDYTTNLVDLPADTLYGTLYKHAFCVDLRTIPAPHTICCSNIIVVGLLLQPGSPKAVNAVGTGTGLYLRRASRAQVDRSNGDLGRSPPYFHVLRAPTWLHNVQFERSQLRECSLPLRRLGMDLKPLEAWNGSKTHQSNILLCM